MLKEAREGKDRAYGQRVWEVEHAAFVPIVMSATGGLSKQATHLYERLASLLGRQMGPTLEDHPALAEMFPTL